MLYNSYAKYPKKDKKPSNFFKNTIIPIVIGLNIGICISNLKLTDTWSIIQFIASITILIGNYKNGINRNTNDIF